jgi:hypothetical protein
MTDETPTSRTPLPICFLASHADEAGSVGAYEAGAPSSISSVTVVDAPKKRKAQALGARMSWRRH